MKSQAFQEPPAGTEDTSCHRITGTWLEPGQSRSWEGGTDTPVPKRVTQTTFMFLWSMLQTRLVLEMETLAWNKHKFGFPRALFPDP